MEAMEARVAKLALVVNAAAQMGTVVAAAKAAWVASPAEAMATTAERKAVGERTAVEENMATAEVESAAAVEPQARG